jgi:transcriptional regulator with XRE-family HTH domain
MKFNLNTKKAVGNNVRRLREARNVSAPEAAMAVGVHRSWWNLLENGTLNFTIDKLDKVAEYLGVSVRDLLTEPGSQLTTFAQDEVPPAKAKRRKAS